MAFGSTSAKFAPPPESNSNSNPKPEGGNNRRRQDRSDGNGNRGRGRGGARGMTNDARMGNRPYRGGRGGRGGGTGGGRGGADQGYRGGRFGGGAGGGGGTGQVHRVSLLRMVMLSVESRLQSALSFELARPRTERRITTKSSSKTHGPRSSEPDCIFAIPPTPVTFP